MNRHVNRSSWMLVSLLAVVLVLSAACGDDDDETGAGSDDALVITDVWSRPAALLDVGESEDHEMDETAEEGGMEHDMEGTAEDAMESEDGMDMGGTNGVVYMTVENEGDEDDLLVAASTDVAEAVELHNVTMADGVMQMRQVEGGIEIPAGETVVLEPGGLHDMLIGLSRSLEVGDEFEVELEFEQAGSMTVDVEVREP